MMVYTKRNDLFDIFEVTPDLEALKQVKGEIRENCSIIVVKTLTMDTDYSNSDTLSIINTSVVEDDEMGKMFENTCKKYTLPPIINSINKLIDGDETAIKDIFANLKLNISPKKQIDFLRMLKVKAMDNDDIELSDSCSKDIDNIIYPTSKVEDYADMVLDCFDFKYFETRNSLREREMADMAYLNNIPKKNSKKIR